MANENETVEEVCNEMREAGKHNAECPKPALMITHHRYHGTREIKRLNPDDWYYGEIDCNVLLDLSARILAAHKRELAEKDARIARLNERLTACANDMLEQDDEIEKRDSLIKELADALERNGIRCREKCSDDCYYDKCPSCRNRALVAKAREVVK